MSERSLSARTTTQTAAAPVVPKTLAGGAHRIDSAPNGAIAAKELDVSILLSTYEKPWHLQRVLASIALQQHVAGKFELIVTDDGSTDETVDVVDLFARSVDFPVRLTTHRHDGFRLARCRNMGAAVATAPYLLFVDGDCLLPPDHVYQHLRRRRPGQTMGGYCYRLDQASSERIDLEVVRRASYLNWATARERRALRTRHLKSLFYGWLRHPRKPKLAGGNIGIWRSDYERVNGYDEQFVGWGAEDDDLRIRLGRAGVRIASILNTTRTYHLWHPPEPTRPKRTREGRNFLRLTQRGKLTCCRRGLRQRSLSDLRISISSEAVDRAAQRKLLDAHLPWAVEGNAEAKQPPEVEVVFFPGEGRFGRGAECKLLIVTKRCHVPRRLVRQADILVADQPLPDFRGHGQFPLSQFAAALETIG